MTRPIETALVALLALSACTPPPAPTAFRTGGRSDAAAVAACRARADEVYEKQNRVELSLRDQRDIPFASQGLSGITSQGLGARFGRDQMVADCLNNVGGGPAGAGPTQGTPGPTMSPAGGTNQPVGPVR